MVNTASDRGERAPHFPRPVQYVALVGRPALSPSGSNWGGRSGARCPAPAPVFAAARPNLSAYALGWTITDCHGERVTTHGGGVYGGISKVVLLPDRGVAFAVLTNAEEYFAVDAVAYDLLDYYLGRLATDWVSRGKAVCDRDLAAAAKVVKAALAPRAVNPPLPLQTCVGV